MSLLQEFFVYTGILFWTVVLLFGSAWLFCRAVAKAQLRRSTRLTPSNPQ